VPIAVIRSSSNTIVVAGTGASPPAIDKKSICQRDCHYSLLLPRALSRR
jgi:hypothetical protein